MYFHRNQSNETSDQLCQFNIHVMPSVSIFLEAVLASYGLLASLQLANGRAKTSALARPYWIFSDYVNRQTMAHYHKRTNSDGVKACNHYVLNNQI